MRLTTVEMLAECEVAARQVVAGRYRLHLSRHNLRTTTSVHVGGGSPPPHSPGWVPQGVLLAHLHEHTARIHRYDQHPPQR